MPEPGPTTTTRRDLWIIGLVTLGVFLLASALDSIERLPRLTSQESGRLLDEILFAIMALSVGLAIVSWRRGRELLAERDRRQQSEASYRLLFESNPQPAWAYDLETLRFLAVNEAAEAQYGYTHAEFLALTLRDLRPPEDIPALLDSVKATGPEPERSGPWRHRTRGGQLRQVEIASSPITFAGRAARLVVAHDVTDRVAEHRQLVTAESLYRTLTERMPAMIAFTEPVPGRTGELYTSPQIETILGYTSAEFNVTPTYWFELLHPDDRARIEAEVVRTTETGEQFHAEFRLRHRDGTRYVWFQAHSVLVYDEAGEPAYWQGILLDITARKEAEAALREAEARFRLLVEQLPAVTIIEAPGTPGEALYISPQVESILGYSPRELIGRPSPMLDLVHPDDRARMLKEFARTDDSGEAFKIDMRMIARDGRTVWMYNEAVLVRDEQGNRRYWQGVFVDTTEQHAAEAARREAELRFQTLVEQMPAVTYMAAPGDLSEVTYLSPQITELIGYAPEELTGVPGLWYSRVHPDDRARLVATDAATLNSRGTLYAEYRLITASGEVVWVQDAAMLTRGADDEPSYWQGVLVDITGRKAAESAIQQSEQRFRYQALHDPLTDLPNRTLFEDRLSHALSGASRRAGQLAVVFLDLDNFKVVNDSLGHRAGDELLQVVADRLTSSVREGDTVARLGGDEFTMLLEGLTGPADAVAVVERVVEKLLEPIYLQSAGHEVSVRASLGIALADEPKITAEELIRRADVAMYSAKRGGKARHALFDPSMQDDAWLRLAVEVELRRAMANGELEVFYQPVVDLAGGAICEVEALARWRHAERGIILPADFLPVAAESGLIADIDRWVLSQAVRRVAAWQQEFPAYADLTVSVNVSSQWLQEPTLADDVAGALDAAGFAARHLKLEITEQAMLADLGLARAALHRLYELGVRLAIDDFGTGSAALTFLREIPVDTLKIDRSFVAGMAHNTVDTSLVRALVTLAKSLGLAVTAEGIEDSAYALLRRFGCDLGQGYVFARPLPPSDLADLLASGTRYPVADTPPPPTPTPRRRAGSETSTSRG